MEQPVSKPHGGKRKGAGRKPISREPKKRLRAVWCWTTQEEQHLINAKLTATERTKILLEAIDNEQRTS